MESMESMETAASAGSRDGDARDPILIGAALAEGLGTYLDATTPKKQKARLMQRVVEEVNDPRMHLSIVGRAVDLVVYHGVPLEDLNRILIDVREMRRAGTLRSAGAFFLGKARALAARYGVPWSGPRAKGEEL